MHDNKILHRDIKPENLVIDYDGYMKVTDLSISRVYKPENKADCCGTPGYMGMNLNYIFITLAPEVICK